MRPAVLACLALLSGCNPSGNGAPATGSQAPATVEPVRSDTTDSVVVGDPPTNVPAALDSPPADWTTRTTTVDRAAGVATAEGLRTAAHDGFDRVVFQFEGGMPGYHVEYVDRPAYACGSGDPMYLAGEAWLLVRLRPARAHDDAGNATITTRHQSFDHPVLREAVITCDFEADLTLVLGLTDAGGYRLAELDAPARLVVDLRH